MRIYPKNPLRLLAAVVVGLALGCFLAYRQGWINPVWYVYHPHIRDEAGVLGPKDRAGLEHTVRAVRAESAVDLWILMVPSTGGESLEALAVRRARELGIGRNTNRRAALFVFDAAGRRMRIEVGPKLEDVFTDAFVGYLLREHLRTFMEAGSPSLGLRTTLMITQDRIRRAMLRDGFDPGFLTFIEHHRRLAEGAGATARLVAKGGGDGFRNRPASALARAYFTAQPTVEQAYQRYLEWCALDAYVPNVPLFTGESVGYLEGLPMTRPFQRFLISAELGARHAVDERGSLALLYFTADPLLGPHFFRKGPAGWQMDMMAEGMDTRNYAGGWASWGMWNSGDDFNEVFADRMLDFGGLVRIAGGDNRVIPRLGESPEPAPVIDTSIARLSVGEAAEQIRAARGRATVVLVYCPCKPEVQQVVAELADLIGDVLRSSHAPFPRYQLYRWPSGTLFRSLASVGIPFDGQYFESPLFAVLDAEGRLVAKGQGIESTAPIEAALSRIVARP